jgi:hypothetical protein
MTKTSALRLLNYWPKHVGEDMVGFTLFTGHEGP